MGEPAAGPHATVDAVGRDAGDAGGARPAARGLTTAEVAERVAAGRTNEVPSAPSRTVGQILRANVATPVNAVIGALLVAILVARGGPSADMLFAGVIVANSAIGTVQELRARAALHRLAVLQQPTALAVRDGTEVELSVGEVVQDDVLVLGTGAQLVVDGEVLDGRGLELDESLLTGEADAVAKGPGDEVLSGSFVVAGTGHCRATRVGAAAYAAALAEEARRFSLVDSDLRRGINRIIKVLMLLIPPVAALLFWRLLEVSDDWRDALAGVVAASVAMVPDGLVLLTSLAFMAGVITLARRQALLRELASVELLARVDTLCLDKTGTITTGDIHVAEVVPVPAARDTAAGTPAAGTPAAGTDPADVRACLAALAGAEADPNPTLAAIARHVGEPPGWTVLDTVAFSSARKWSAASFATGPGTLRLYLGAPEYLAPDDPGVMGRVQDMAGSGRRVVLLATADAQEVDGRGVDLPEVDVPAPGVPRALGEQLPEELHPLALVGLEDGIRPDAQAILDYFSQQGVALKVISGDHPDTVAAVARRAGVPGAEAAVDARTLPDDTEQLGEALDHAVVLGRVTPRQKQSMVRALQARGRVVAMTGDGVNDVLALKDADMGIAMGAGSTATRAVAQLVLLENRFSVLPVALAEGRRVINSVERAANLFVYGTVYSVLVSVAIAVVGTDFPFLPRHLTLVRVLSVGVPGIFLALAPDPRRARPGFLARVVRFAVPAGAVAAVAALAVYLLARRGDRVSLVEARTAATITLLGVGLAILLRLTRSLPPWRWGLVGAMAAAVVAVMAVPWLAATFDMELPPGGTWVLIVVAVAAAGIALHFVPVTAEGGDVPPPADPGGDDR